MNPSAFDELRASVRTAMDRHGVQPEDGRFERALDLMQRILSPLSAEQQKQLIARMDALVRLNVERVFESVNRPRGLSQDRDEIAGILRELYEGRNCRHLEMGVHTGFREARVEDITKQNGLSVFIRLDLDPDVKPDVVADCARLPFPDNSLDSVASDSLFEHIRRPRETIAESYRVLAPGGVMQINTPFFFTIHGYPNDYMRLTPQFFEETCREIGFERIYCHVYDFGGVYYTLHNSSKQVIIDETIDPELKASAVSLHFNVMTLLMLASAFDECFYGHSRNVFIGVYCVAFKPGQLVGRSRPQSPADTLLDQILPYLVCPETRQPLSRTSDGAFLCTPDGSRRYPVEKGIPILVVDRQLADGLTQRGPETSPLGTGAKQGEAVRLHETRAERDGEVERFHRPANERSQEIEALRADAALRDSQVRALEAQNLLLLRSWSWRLTRPLRITPAKLRQRLRLIRAARFVRRSRLFDAKFYLERNPDVGALGVDPVWHYLLGGASEGRDPHPDFDTSFYLERNPDVARAGVNPLVHYLVHGAAEGRHTQAPRNASSGEAREAPSRPRDDMVARQASSSEERTQRSDGENLVEPVRGSPLEQLNDRGSAIHARLLRVKPSVTGAEPMRSVSFNTRDGNRYWWHRLPTSSYVPPIYGLLSDDEWHLMDDWFTETDRLYSQGTGECNVPLMCMLQGLIMGSGITRIVQCGHYIGYSTLLIGFMLRRMNRARGLLSIDVDTNATEYTAQWVAKAGLDEQVSLIVSDSVNPDLPGVVRQHFGDRDPQVVFIDSSHQYEHTLAELDLWYRILMPGGLLLLHDMSRFAAGFDPTGRGGVFRAASEWSVANGATMLALGGFIDGSSQEHAYADGCGLGVIQKAAPRGV